MYTCVSARVQAVEGERCMYDDDVTPRPESSSTLPIVMLRCPLSAVT